jgi:hypothetical protein
MRRDEGPGMEIISGFSDVCERPSPGNSRLKGFVSKSVTGRLLQRIEWDCEQYDAALGNRVSDASH